MRRFMTWRSGAGSGRWRVAAPFVLMAVAASVLAAARPDLKAYFQSGFADAAYQQGALNKVLKAWTSPASWPKPGSKTVVQTAIGRDGKLINALVSMASGSAEWDAAALAAVKQASPFAPLPRTYGRPNLQVHWHFSVVP